MPGPRDSKALSIKTVGESEGPSEEGAISSCLPPDVFKHIKQSNHTQAHGCFGVQGLFYLGTRKQRAYVHSVMQCQCSEYFFSVDMVDNLDSQLDGIANLCACL